MAARTVLSIDFDFFPWNGGMADSVKMIGDPPIRESWLYDWDCTERHHPFIRDAVWAARASSFRYIGLDIERECAIRPELGCVAPERFADELFRRFDHGGATVMVADSHVSGFDTVVAASLNCDDLPVDVVHFDAHADLGYDDGTLKREWRKNTFDCGSWLYHAIRLNFVRSATVVYPDWRGMREWETVKQSKEVADLIEGGTVTATTYTEWLSRAYTREPVQYVNVCRSGAWVPPHLDPLFETLPPMFGSMVDIVPGCGDLAIRPTFTEDVKAAADAFRTLRSQGVQ